MSSITQHEVDIFESRLVKIIERGPWALSNQLCAIYIHNLPASPWLDLAQYPSVAEAARLLQQSADGLRADFANLQEHDLLWHDEDCIAARGGAWLRFEANGIEAIKDGEGCSIYTPSACRLFQALRPTGVKGLRVSFSVVAPNTWLQPHFGPTNANLKLHLGLVIPRAADGTPCARMRVDSEWRAWEQDAILFFDDSFEHEVVSECTLPRTVFQLVFRHPALPPDEQGRMRTVVQQH